jgi:hypothetical protein
MAIPSSDSRALILGLKMSPLVFPEFILWLFSIKQAERLKKAG